MESQGTTPKYRAKDMLGGMRVDSSKQLWETSGLLKATNDFVDERESINMFGKEA